MIRGLYAPRDSLVHRLAPGAKLLALALAGTGLFLTANLWVLSGAGLAVLALFPLARLSPADAWRQLRPALPILVILALTQVWLGDPQAAPAVLLRLSTLILLAGLVTLTTRTADMVETLEWALTPLRGLGVDPAKVGLAISLALRFIPALSGVLDEVREAQKARGLERNVLALAVPLIVRTLKMADEIAEAIDARS